MMLPGIARLHFVGAGGVGMCALAEVLLAAGREVSGCDLAASERTLRLERLGARIQLGHSPLHVSGIDALVVSSAVAADDTEVAAARRAGIPVVRRAELLGELMRGYHGVAVAGTHGKTTTTALVAAVLDAGGFEPTVVAGGRVHGLGGHGRLGTGPLLVCEADEFDRSFLALHPVWAVITNIEPEHLDCYGSAEALEAAFSEFASRVPFYGAVIACSDDPGVVRVVARLGRRLVTYGEGPDAQVRAEAVRTETLGSRFTVTFGGRSLGELWLPAPGRHNVANALAAIAIGLTLGVPFGAMRERLAGFSGVARRFERIGEREGVTVVDDYAHHPTELRATLAAARQAYPGRRLVAVFQPHLFSRTRDFADGFADALASADLAVLLPIYAAREHPLPGVSSDLVAHALELRASAGVHRADSVEAAVGVLDTLTREGDVVVTLGAGDIFRLGPMWLGGRS